jgi:hypothetical protein
LIGRWSGPIVPIINVINGINVIHIVHAGISPGCPGNGNTDCRSWATGAPSWP